MKSGIRPRIHICTHILGGKRKGSSAIVKTGSGRTGSPRPLAEGCNASVRAELQREGGPDVVLFVFTLHEADQEHKNAPWGQGAPADAGCWTTHHFQHKQHRATPHVPNTYRSTYGKVGFCGAKTHFSCETHQG